MINSLYLLILKDSFLSSLIISPNGELVYPTILRLNKADPVMASLFALLGSVAGLVLLYLLFYIAAKLLHKLLNSNPTYPSAQHYVSKYSPIGGILIAVPKLYMIPVFFFGITKMNFKKFIIITVAYRILYYIYAIYTIHPLF